MTRILTLVSCVAVWVFAANAVDAQNATEGYAALKDRPLPRASADRDSECVWIRTQIERIQSQSQSAIATAAQYNSPALAQSIKAAADRDVPQLQERYAMIRCAGPVPGGSAPAPPQTLAAAPAPPQTLVVAPAPPQTLAAAPAPPQTLVVAPAQAAAAIPAPPQTTVASPPASSAPAIAAPMLMPQQPCVSGLDFDQCFTKCRELTDRTKAQCFDACRR